MRTVTLILLATAVSLASTQIIGPARRRYDEDIMSGSYCQSRRGPSCCPDRDDTCTTPILGTLCYCDEFCLRNTGADCCPDYRPYCKGEKTTPKPGFLTQCYFEDRYYKKGDVVKKNCNTCKCVEGGEIICENNPCLVREEVIKGVNNGHYGWKAANYSFFWGKTLKEGIQYKLGTFKPDHPVMKQHGITTFEDDPSDTMFDAREEWPDLIQDIRNQGNCGASWAISTADVAADRLAIQSKGKEKIALSPEHLLSCQNGKQKGCKGGYTDRAWRFFHNYGVVSEECLSYTSGDSGKPELCPFQNRHSNHKVECPEGGSGRRHRTPPPYRIKPREHEIRKEIKKNGPVQAIIIVRDDFFVYQSGVYRHVDITQSTHNLSGYQSVRIVGWGVDYFQRTPVKYWLCANSWGKDWGEDGYFKIVRGENESEVEQFVVAVWAKPRETDDDDDDEDNTP